MAAGEGVADMNNCKWQKREEEGEGDVAAQNAHDKDVRRGKDG